MISTGIYVRVSTEEQAREGYSIRAQQEKLRTYADIKGWTVFRVYTDEGISGKDIGGRPAIKELIADVESGKINNVLVYKIDRLTRSTKNLIELIDLFNLHNCAFNSLNESIDTGSATGRMFLKIVGIFAEFERENLAERIRMGRERKVREGYSICSWTQSYGYRRELGQNKQVVVPEEAAVVRRIFNMYLHDNLSLNKIAKTLNAENIPTKTQRNLWLGCTVKVLLRNPTYLGKVRYSMNDPEKYFEADGQHEAIIEEAIFYQTQEKLERIRKFSRTKRAGSAVYFCGVLYCSACGGRMTTKWNYNRRADGSKKEHANYKCTNAHRGICSSCTLSHKKVEAAFEKYIHKFENFSIAAPKTNAQVAELPETDITDRINAELAQIAQKNEEVISLFVASRIDFSTYQTMLKMGNKRKNELNIRLNLLKNANDTDEYSHKPQGVSASLYENWARLDNEQRQQFVQRFISKILVHGEATSGYIRDKIVIDAVIFNEH